jgi:ubiquinone/menaquinone biosynthesis C-methylase UbiE
MIAPQTALRKPSPFDALAPDYDKLFTHSVIGRAQRQSVWRRLRTTFKPGSRVLEINCGTGVDAAFLAKLGVRVLAVDSSEGMITVTQTRIAQACLQEWVSTRQLAIEALSRLQKEGPFDGVLSNFGGLNCVEHIEPVAKDLARLVKPGSRALLCLMGRWCAWEMAYYLSRGQSAKAFRRVRGSAKSLSFNAQLRVCYPGIRQLARAFTPYFRVRAAEAIGLFVPPSYLETWIARHPRFLRLATALDTRVSQWPGLRHLGDHYLVEMERTSTSLPQD